MPADTWENLIGAVVEGRYRLRALTYSGRDQAEYLADAEPEAGGDPLTVTLIAAAPEDIDAVRTQLHAVSRLQHPNLVRIDGAGESAVEGRFMLYLASETPDQTLEAALKPGPMAKDAVRALALNVLDALAFLHGQGLVYRALDPQTTVRVNGRWKLADYGMVCPAGETSPEPPPFASPYLPPEAKTGPVTPAWDMWAFGILLRQALAGHLSQPFKGVVERCLESQPERRLTVQDARGLLEPRQETPAPAAPSGSKIAVRSDVWRTLRIIALLALVCLAALLPFGLRKKKAAAPPPAPAPARAAAPVAAAPAIPKPTPMTGGPARKTAGAEFVRADYISSRMNGRRTASGERFDGNSLTASTRAYPLGTRLRVTNLANSKTVVVKINDRGRRGRTIGLSERAAREIGMTRSGSAKVMLEAIE